MLRCAFVVSGTPGSDALQAEDVIAPVNHTELLSICKYWLQADLALSILALVKVARRGLVVCLVAKLVGKLALVAVPATICLVKDADAFGGSGRCS